LDDAPGRLNGCRCAAAGAVVVVVVAGVLAVLALSLLSHTGAGWPDRATATAADGARRVVAPWPSRFCVPPVLAGQAMDEAGLDAAVRTVALWWRQEASHMLTALNDEGRALTSAKSARVEPQLPLALCRRATTARCAVPPV
jgi:hypothetical protein